MVGRETLNFNRSICHRKQQYKSCEMFLGVQSIVRTERSSLGHLLNYNSIKYITIHVNYTFIDICNLTITIECWCCTNGWLKKLFYVTSNVKIIDWELFYNHNITSLAIIWMDNNKKDQISKYASLINFGFKMKY